ncbi:unannotated protein [freshwater metagenome]|uniref:Unannotated protein n=1 Tax=freshwater metagenome TaxID=449393 RepID=A0A6J6TIX7_9ZZZZ
MMMTAPRTPIPNPVVNATRRPLLSAIRASGKAINAEPIIVHVCANPAAASESAIELAIRAPAGNAPAIAIPLNTWAVDNTQIVLR